MTTRVDSSRVAYFSCATHIFGVFYANSLATRLPISRVDFYQDESWRLESTRVESPTVLTLPHILGLFFTKSLATRLPISRVDFYQDESWRPESPRVELPTFLALPHILGVFYAKSLATRFPVTRVNTYHRRLDSMLVYWTTIACTRHTQSKTFANSLNMQKQFENMLGKRVMTRTRYR